MIYEIDFQPIEDQFNEIHENFKERLESINVGKLTPETFQD